MNDNNLASFYKPLINDDINKENMHKIMFEQSISVMLLLFLIVIAIKHTCIAIILYILLGTMIFFYIIDE
jgi:hypothetical protein